MNGSWETCLVGSLSSGKVHEEGGRGGEEGRNAKEPAPLSRRNGEGKEGEASKDQGGNEADRDLPKLNHQSKDSGESPALLAGEPGGIDLHHSWAAKGLKPAIHQPDQGESHKGSCKGCETEDEVDRDGSDGPDQEGGASADLIGQESVDELASAIRQ